MDVDLRRQIELKTMLSDNLTNMLTYLFRTKQITYEEMSNLVEEHKEVFYLPPWLTTQQETETMSKGVIVQRAADKSFDEKYLDIAMAERDEYMGFAFADGGEITHGEMPLANKAEAKEEIATTPNHPLILTFQTDVGTEESKQPFVTLTNEAGKALCVCFINGDLQGAPESSHSPEWTKHQEYVVPKVIDIFTDCGEDVDKTIEKLDRALTKSEMGNNCFLGALANGEILLLFANGKTVNIIKGDKHKKYEWGETSLAFGYEAKAINEEKTAAVKKGLGGRASAPAVTKTEDKKPNTAMAAAIAKAEDKKTGLDYMIVPPVVKFQSIQGIEGWYSAFTDAENKPTTEEMHKMKGQAHLAIPVKIKSTISNTSFNKLLENKSILLAPTKDKPVATETKVEIPMVIIPNAEREKLDKEFWPKIAAGDSKLVVDPVVLNKFLEGKPLASMQLGKQIQEFEGFSEGSIDYMIKNTPTAAKAMIIELLHENYKSNIALKKATELKKAM